MSEFKVGDVVVLKSGSPRMTVTAILTDLKERVDAVVCVWFDKDENMEMGKFSPNTIKLDGLDGKESKKETFIPEPKASQMK